MSVTIVSIDRYEGETDDILKKIAEAGEEEPEDNKVTEKKKRKMSKEEFDRVLSFSLFCSHIPEFKPEDFTKLADMGFCNAPASKKYHGNHPGGLLEHSCVVTGELCDLSVNNNLKWERTESPVIIGLFHDLCKIDQYTLNEDGTYSWNKEVDQRHGEKSVEYIEKYTHIKLTDEEKACILHHVGAFGDREAMEAYSEAIKKYPNVLWVHTADMIASHIKNV